MTGNSRFAVSLHILAYLAYRGGRAVPSAEIASSVDTNPVVIRRLLSTLARAGLVHARKGAAGGFALARPPRDISLVDVYRAAEPDPDTGLRHFAPNGQCPVGAKIAGVLHGVFSRAQATMEAELARATLGDLHEQLQPVCPGSHRRERSGP